MQIFSYNFKPKLIPTLATLIVLPVLISLGNWQVNKADKKQALQDVYDKRGQDTPLDIGSDSIDLEAIRFSRVVARGSFEPAYQILLDNQIYQGQAGYHVITPLHISGSNVRVLVNRGWLPVGDERAKLPLIETPQGEIEIIGNAHDPAGKYLELMQAKGTHQTWQTVWQNWDAKRYTSVVPFSIHPFFILLDSASPVGGFVRVWPKPEARIEINRGYAIQWYFMSFALVIIYLVTNIKKISTQQNKVEDQVNA